MNLMRLRILLGVLGLVPIFIGLSGIFSGLERLVSGCEFSSDHAMALKAEPSPPLPKP